MQILATPPEIPSVALSECRDGTKQHHRLLHFSNPPFSGPLLHATDMGDNNNFPRKECRCENKMVGVLQAADDARIITYPQPLLVATSDQEAKEVFVN